MGVALAAVTEDRHVLALDQGQVGGVVIEHLGHGGLSFGLLLLGGTGLLVARGDCWRDVTAATRPFPRSAGDTGRDRDRDRAPAAFADRPRPTADGDHARLHELADPERLEHPAEVSELVGVAG